MRAQTTILALVANALQMLLEQSHASMLDSNLCDNSNSTQHGAMVIHMVPVHLVQDVEFLEASIQGLMTCSTSSMLNSFRRSLNQVILCSNVHLRCIQVHHQLLPEDCSVWIRTSRKRPIDPNNLCTDIGDADLVSNSRMVEFL